MATEDKIAFVDRLSDAGHRVIEVSAFVSPKWVPQMADADARSLRASRGVPAPAIRHSCLTGRVSSARSPRPSTEVAVFAAASETFSRRNINQSIDESLANYATVCADARAAGLRVRGYLSTCFACPFEGPVDPTRVADIAGRLLEIGVYEVAISDTIGAATPGDVLRVLGTVSARLPLHQVALHFHDTRGTALANVLAGLDYGVTTFDSSAGGLGGCPFAPGAAGNLATEDLLFMLNGLGIDTGVSIDRCRRRLDASSKQSWITDFRHAISKRQD